MLYAVSVPKSQSEKNNWQKETATDFLDFSTNSTK